MTSLLRKPIKTWKRFWADANGAVLFYITATLPALVGFSLLAIDASRLMTLHTSLQKGVDALSLAAAGELDRGPNAMERSQLAAQHLLENTQVFGQGVAHIGADLDASAAVDLNVTLAFYSALPTSDADPMPTSGATVLDPAVPEDNTRARFVQVTVDNYNLNSIFPASFLGAGDSATSNATAVAGMSQVICRLTPIFICNPWEPATNTDLLRNIEIYDNTDTRRERKVQIRTRMGPGGVSWGPGNYGFLDFGNGATALERALAIGSPDNCFVDTGVDTEPGQTTGPVKTGINVRFGMYPNSMTNIGVGAPPENQWEVRPGKNVRMGQDQRTAANQICKDYVPDTADAAATPPHVPGLPLPRDPIFTPTNDVHLGVEAVPTPPQWASYWDANFAPGMGSFAGNAPTAGVVAPAITEPAYQAETAAPNWENVTRYEMYKYEIATAMQHEIGVGDEVADPHSAGTGGGARCYTGPAVAADVIDRRLIGTAILNCLALAAAGNDLNGKQTEVPVAAFGEFFVTEPVEQGGAGTAGDIYTEFVRIIEPGNENSVARDQVQIYR